jgi:hypothetical protein
VKKIYIRSQNKKKAAAAAAMREFEGESSQILYRLLRDERQKRKKG